MGENLSIQVVWYLWPRPTGGVRNAVPCFLTASFLTLPNYPPLVWIPHPASHFRLRWRIQNSRKQLWFDSQPNYFLWVVWFQFCSIGHKKGLISQNFTYIDYPGLYILRDTYLHIFYPLAKDRKSCLSAAESHTTPYEYSHWQMWPCLGSVEFKYPLKVISTWPMQHGQTANSNPF